jgi:hypothetical protein
LFRLVKRSGKPVISNNPNNYFRRKGLPSAKSSIDGFMCLSFYKNKEMVGMICIANRPNG